VVAVAAAAVVTLMAMNPFTAQGCHFANASCSSDHEVSGEAAVTWYSDYNNWQVWLEDNAGGQWQPIDGTLETVTAAQLQQGTDGLWHFQFGPMDIANIHAGATQLKVVGAKQTGHGPTWTEWMESEPFDRCQSTTTLTESNPTKPRFPTVLA